VLWVRLDKDQTKAVDDMLEGMNLDGAKLGRLALAALDQLRSDGSVETYLRALLGPDGFDRAVS
jgi:hypothetical protein